MRRSTLASLVLVLSYTAFWCWYTPLRGPLTTQEIDRYVSVFAQNGSSAVDQQRLRRFLEADTGDDFVMFNVIELRSQPTPVEGVDPSDSASAVLDQYMEYMWPALLRRASHPVLYGTATGEALESWGVEATRAWTTGAAMRYRSRRDMMEITTNPAFQGRHGFKIAAINKTVAFPADPWRLFGGGPRLMLGLVVVILLLLLRRVPGSRRSRLALSGRLR